MGLLNTVVSLPDTNRQILQSLHKELPVLNPSVFQRVCVKSSYSSTWRIFFFFCNDPQLQFHLIQTAKKHNETEECWLAEHKSAVFFLPLALL